MQNYNLKFKIGILLILIALAIYFYFMPVFAGRIRVQPGFNIGTLSFRFYGLILALAILLGYLTARRNSWRFGIDKKEVDDLAFWLVLSGIVGARLYFVLFDFGYFLDQPQEIYKIWHGGLSIYGAIIFGLLFLILYAKKKAYTRFHLLDLVALSLPLSQALGRFGNFFNQEAYGGLTGLPWKMFVASQNDFFHPTFLYEALGLVIVFFALKKIEGEFASGVLAFSYLAGYSLVRFFIEPLRTDSVFISGFRADQIVAFVMVCFSLAMIFFRLRSVETR